ncbi:MAG: hypothetical protein MUF72_21365 [Elainella sp. Prado103]|nr:hypothetical protein [Elainella sp. Prado103]
MPIDLMFQTDVLAVHHFDRVEFIQSLSAPEQILSVAAEPEVIEPSRHPQQSSNAGLILGLILFILFVLKVFGILEETEIPNPSDQSNKISNANIPCSSCRFFARNLYIKCAVRPSEVLTQQAIHCADYDPTPDIPTNQPQARQKSEPGTESILELESNSEES